MRVTTLIDNLVYSRNLIAEHGLSFYIQVETEHKAKERESHKILFDCGQSSIFARNAHNLGVDLKEIDTVVISHGHYDHTGGLEKFIEINKTAKIYIKKEALLEKFNGNRYIGIPKELFKSELSRELKIEEQRLIFPTEQITQISASLYLASFPSIKNSTKSIDKANCLKANSAQHNKITGFNVLQNGQQVEDCFNDEQYLVFIKNNKISLITGCSHRGILNIIALVQELYKLPVKEIIGGLHTKKQTPKEIHNLSQELNKCRVKSLKINHCTGVEAYAILKERLKADISYNYTGKQFKSIL